MKLSELSIKKLEVTRDCEFLSIGRINERGKNKKLVALIDQKKASLLPTDSSVSGVITASEFVDRIPKALGVCVSDNPERALYEIHNSLANSPGFFMRVSGRVIDASAEIHPSAHIAEDGVKIGKKCDIGPGVTVMENVVLEDNVILRPGTVVGGDSAISYEKDGKLVPVVSTGGVHIHSNVEMHANCCVNRALFGGWTEIGEYTKFDNLVSVGQNVKIGKRCVIPACAVLGDESVIGDDVWIGPNAVVCEGIVVGDKAYVTLGSVVTEDVAPGKKVTGNFAIDHAKFIEFIKKIR
jgi:UDP-3-O-[3-hydroxymyristoyl] glucosamine N-acyltransferase